MTVRVHVAIQNAVLRECVAQVLHGRPGIEVTELSTDGEVGAAAAAKSRPAVVVMTERPGQSWGSGS